MTITAIPPQIAVINKSAHVRDDDLGLICAALGKGVNRDFAPRWHASVAIHALKHPPAAWWHAYVQDGLDEPGAAGYHTDKHNQPIIYVDATAGELSLTLDHEVKETLADPFGSRLVAMTLRGRRVQVLAEVCDPCEDARYAYTVDGVQVSDFALPAFYAPARKGGINPKTCHVANLAPGVIGPGGYISYLDQGVWKQDTWFDGGEPTTTTLGAHEDIAEPGESLRETIDRVTRENRARA